MNGSSQEIYFKRYSEVVLADLDPDLASDLLDAGASRNARSKVERIIDTYDVHGDPADIRDYLECRIDIWDGDIDDEDENLFRMVSMLAEDLHVMVAEHEIDPQGSYPGGISWVMDW